MVPALAILNSWAGLLSLPAEPGSFTAPPQDELAWVIRDQAAYDQFVGQIPTKRVQKRQPAPPSEDPLLKKPAVDFAKHMLLVVGRDDMYVGPKIASVSRNDAGLAVVVELPDPGDSAMAARVLGMGRYHAVKVERVEGPVKWTFRKAAATP